VTHGQTTNQRQRLAHALKNLTGALGRLEASAAQRAQVDSDRAALEEEFGVMQDDRARLALELDGCLVRADILASANLEVSQRLEQISLAIRSILTEPE
jgi:hypothetical protein